MKLKHWIVFILLGLIWSTSFLWIKIGIREVGPMALVAFRLFFGALTAVAIAAYQKVKWPQDWKTWGIFAILGPTSLPIPIFLISWQLLASTVLIIASLAIANSRPNQTVLTDTSRGSTATTER